ncbi:MAG TPA: YccF domain-containing protein [Clostridia bacterium]|nr:YccF domain-containing protein [Clostridia bacterium]
MKTIGNIIWVIFGGLILSLMWVISGILCCATIVGIPLGIQCFKFARLALWPFDREILYGNSVVSLISNILWIVFFGIEMSFICFLLGALFCITIVGIPFGIQFWKFAKLSLMPFGAKIVKI